MTQTKGGALLDKEGRKVNQLGYLIDKQGRDVVNRQGKVVFRSDELASDGDLPEPFFTQKHVTKLSIVVAQNSPKKQMRVDLGSETDLANTSAAEDERLKVAPFRSRMGMSNRLSQSSYGGDGRSAGFASRANERPLNHTQEADNEEEEISLDKILQPM